MTQTKQIERASETPVRFHTVSAIVRGGLCGNIWMPNVKCGIDFTDDLHARFNRFSDKSGATFRDALLSAQNEKGGDFQSVSFTADTVLIIKRVRTIKPNYYETRIREIAVIELPDCEDLVDAETYSYDFNGDDWDSTEILVCPECHERYAHKLANRKSYECQCCGNIFIPKPQKLES